MFGAISCLLTAALWLMASGADSLAGPVTVTLPTQGTSRLALLSITGGNAGSTLSWQPVSGRYYAVYAVTNLIPTPNWTMVAETVQGIATDVTPAVSGPVFYWLDVRQVP